MGKNSETASFKIVSTYVKKADGFVYYYWRIVGSATWNVQKTAMKEVPTIEMVMDVRNKALAHNKPKSTEKTND